MGSACYVYAIVGRDTSLPWAGTASTGRHAAELTLVPCRELAAVTGPMLENGARRTMNAVLRHEAVVEAVRQQGLALPVRFGTVFRDATSVASALAERYESLEADLDRLGDKVELSLTALWPGPSSGEPPTAARELPAGRAARNLDGAAPAGRAARDLMTMPVPQGAGGRYLHARAAELRGEEALKERSRVLAQELDQSVGRLALERRISLLPTPRTALRTAYLLDPARVNAFEAAFAAIRRTRREVRLLLTGPWPPYSFVGRAGVEGGAGSDGRLTALVRRLTDAMQGRSG